MTEPITPREWSALVRERSTSPSEKDAVPASAILAALKSLGGARHARGAAADQVPRSPGLYAFHGDQRAWEDLGLTPAFDGQPLYVGKSETSLYGRDVVTHFSPGKTGSSTVRRSLAALLVDELDVVAVPRNLLKPDASANFALDPGSEERLSAWMGDRLSLATWVLTQGVVLAEIETAVVRRLQPPLNLDKVNQPRERLRRARKRLADASRGRAPVDPVPD